MDFQILWLVHYGRTARFHGENSWVGISGPKTMIMSSTISQTTDMDGWEVSQFNKPSQTSDTEL